MKIKSSFNRNSILSLFIILTITLLFFPIVVAAQSGCKFWNGGPMLMYQEPVALCENSNFTGARFRCGPDSLSFTTRLNDKISSIEVQPGYKLIVFEHRDFLGDRKNFGPGRYSDLGWWNNRISSFEIQKVENRPQTFEPRQKEPNIRAQQNRVGPSYKLYMRNDAEGGSGSYVLQIISRYEAKLRQDNPSQSGQWTNLNIETLARQKIRLSTKLRSGNSISMVLEFSPDMNNLYGEFKYYGIRISVFSVEGSKMY